MVSIDVEMKKQKTKTTQRKLAVHTNNMKKWNRSLISEQDIWNKLFTAILLNTEPLSSTNWFEIMMVSNACVFELMAFKL